MSQRPTADGLSAAQTPVGERLKEWLREQAAAEGFPGTRVMLVAAVTRIEHLEADLAAEREGKQCPWLDETRPRPTAEDAEFPRELMNAPVKFGLEAQGHIPTIEQMLADGMGWVAIGEAIGWHGPTAKDHYERWLTRTRR